MKQSSVAVTEKMPENSLQIDFVDNSSDLTAFVDFPYNLYKDCPNWTPILRMEAKKAIDTKKNIYYKDAKLGLFLAKRNNEVVGRIAAIIDSNYNTYNKTKAGFFGFFECEDHDYTAKMLFKVAEDWVKEKGMEIIIGPANPSFFDPIGVLIEGFEFPNRLLMPYNWAYYDRIISSAGYTKAMDLLAFGVNRETIADERYGKGVELIQRRYPTIKVKKLDLKNMDETVKIIQNIFNQAWAKNWGFSPLPLELLQQSAADLKLIADPDLALLATDGDKPVAFSITLPDIHEVLRKIGNGKLLPFGIFKLLFHKNKVTGLRTALAGVLPEYHNKGVDVLMHYLGMQNAFKKQYQTAEFSWVLEDNINMVRLAERAGGIIEKKYRMYQKALS